MGTGPPSSPFLDRVREAIRVRHYSIRTEDAYVHWIKRFILFHKKRHPEEMGEVEVAAFLSYLATQGNVAAGTQNRALNALVFLYKAVLEHPLETIGGVVRAKKPKRLPFVLSQKEVSEVLKRLKGWYWLLGCLLYGSGLRLMEALRLRVMDLDFERRGVFVRGGKGGKDRVVTLADELVMPLQRHLETVRTLHERDLAAGCGEVYLPHALARKYPNAAREWKWQYVFPASDISKDPRSNARRRHHVHESCMRKAMTSAVRQASIPKKVGCHTLRKALVRDPPP